MGNIGFMSLQLLPINLAIDRAERTVEVERAPGDVRFAGVANRRKGARRAGIVPSCHWAMERSLEPRRWCGVAWRVHFAALIRHVICCQCLLKRVTQNNVPNL